MVRRQIYYAMMKLTSILAYPLCNYPVSFQDALVVGWMLYAPNSNGNMSHLYKRCDQLFENCSGTYIPYRISFIVPCRGECNLEDELVLFAAGRGVPLIYCQKWKALNRTEKHRVTLQHQASDDYEITLFCIFPYETCTDVLFAIP